MKRLTAKDVMNREVLSVGPDWPIDRLADFLVENSISGAPVTSEDGKLVGVVSSTDIIRQESMPGKELLSHRSPDYYLHELEHQYAKEEMKSFRVSDMPLMSVRDIMTRRIFSVNEDTEIQQVADSMIRGRIHRVFVTRKGKLTGIISALDMLQVIRDL
ncbi:MAG: CBS domain-containing protein [Desulfobacteraceae bacterium]|jgi:CBS domain-containing protein